MNQISRKTLAVMFTDVVGFTTIMENSESEALNVLNSLRKVQLPLLKTHRGILVKEMGDGTLSTFPSPVEAVKCARGIQEELHGESFHIRIGIHLGQIIVRENDVLGDPVNVASRIQELAPPGGVCVSGELLQSYGPGRRPATHPMGLRKLKGLGRLVDLFAIRGTGVRPLPVHSLRVEGGTERVASPEDLPSIAVMPLENLGPEGDDFYAYSISSDLVRDIAMAGRIIVTPLSDVERLKKTVGSSHMIAKRLKVRFLVTGTLWRKQETFHLSIELHDLLEGRLAWTDSWIDNWFDLPAIKGKMADGLLKVIGFKPGVLPGITDSETSRSAAYENYLKAREIYWHKKNSSDLETALALLHDSIDSDPELVPGRILLGTIFSESGRHLEAGKVLEKACATALKKGDRAGYLNGLNWTGINQWRQADYRNARNTFLKTLRLARTLGDVTGEARSLSNIGLIDNNMGNYDRALKYLETALGVTGTDEVSSLRANTLCNIGLTHWRRGDNTLAMKHYKSALSLYRVLEDRGGQAYILRNIGIIKRSVGMCEEAVSLTRKAERIYTELGNRLGRCHSLNSIGNIHMYLGQYDLALKYYREALTIAEEMDDRMTVGILNTNLGNIASVRGDHAKALSLHMEALNISRDLGDTHGEAENLTLIGGDHRCLGRLEEAEKALESSVELMEKMGAGGRTATARLDLAEVLLDLDKGPETGNLALEQMETAARILTPETADRTAILWKLSELYGLLAKETSGEESGRMRKAADSFLRESYRTLMETADTLSDMASRISFLENVEDHKKIAGAFIARMKGPSK